VTITASWWPFFLLKVAKSLIVMIEVVFVRYQWTFGNVKWRSLVFVRRWALFAGTIYSEIVREEIVVVFMDRWSLLKGGRWDRLDCTCNQHRTLWKWKYTIGSCRTFPFHYCSRSKSSIPIHHEIEITILTSSPGPSWKHFPLLDLPLQLYLGLWL